MLKSEYTEKIRYQIHMVNLGLRILWVFSVLGHYNVDFVRALSRMVLKSRGTVYMGHFRKQVEVFNANKRASFLEIYFHMASECC